MFNDWPEKVLILDGIRQQERLGWEGPVFLVVDEFSGHLTDLVEENCLFYAIKLLILPAHTSTQVQPVDLGAFAVHKMEARRVHPRLDLND
jgi:hypothetical protein